MMSFVGLLCFQSFSLFQGLAEQHGASGLGGRASLLSSVNVACFFLVGLLGSRAGDARDDDDAEWLSTLPAPAWVLRSARLVEAALTNPRGWLMIFPFFTGLGVHAGLAWLAPLVALGISLPFFLAYTLLGSVVDVISRGSRSSALGILRIVGPALGLLVFAAWLSAPALAAHVDVLGSWLDFSVNLPWLPFSEPARALLSWQAAPLRSLAWLGAFTAEMAVLLGLSALVLRQSYAGELTKGSRGGGVRGAAVERNPATRTHSLRGPFKGIVAKELLCLRRTPALGSQLATVIVIANGVGLWLASRLSEAGPTLRPGIALFSAGVLILIRLATLLELEQPALWQWAALPRSISTVFGCKALFAAGLAAAGAFPAAAYSLLSGGGGLAALPALLYGATCIVVVALFQTGSWLRNANPRAATSRSQETVRLLKVLLVSAILCGGFSSSLTIAGGLRDLLVAAVFGITYWQSSMERAPFVLDPDASRPAKLTSLSAVVVLLLMRFFQNGLQDGLLRRGSSPPTAAAWGLIMAGLVLGAALLWLWLRDVPHLSAQLGLTRGRGWAVILREAALWSGPAVAILLAYSYFFGHHASSLLNEPVTQQPLGMMLSTASAFTLVTMLCVVGPAIEEVAFRGMIYSSLVSGYGKAFSVLVTSLLFMADHTPVNALPIFCGAVCMALAFERSRSLYAAMLVHAAYNGCAAAIILLMR